MHDESCECGIPANCVILNQLHVIEYLNQDDGEIYKIDLSCGGDGLDIPMGKALELAEWARAFTISPMVAELVVGFLEGGDGEDDEEYDPAEV